MSVQMSTSKSNATQIIAYHHPLSSMNSHPSSSSSSSAFTSPSSGFVSGSSTFSTRSAFPTRVKLYRRSSSPQSPRSVRFAGNDRPSSPNRSTYYSNKKNNAVPSGAQNKRTRTCLCSPTTHPGSFRCSLHKGLSASGNHQNNCRPETSSYRSTSPLKLRKSAMKNSLVRIGELEGELGKRVLTALIMPSSYQQRSREAFQPKPSRLSIMSKADDS